MCSVDPMCSVLGFFVLRALRSDGTLVRYARLIHCTNASAALPKDMSFRPYTFALRHGLAVSFKAIDGSVFALHEPPKADDFGLKRLTPKMGRLM